MNPVHKKMGNQMEDESQGNRPKESNTFKGQKDEDRMLIIDPTDINSITRSKYYIFDKNVLGNGSFGVVVEALALETNHTVAIKRVIQDPKYKNRELDIMKLLSHPNIVTLKDYFYTEHPSETGETNRYLNVVMEHIPDNVFQVVKSFSRYNQIMPMILVKLYIYQLCRSLGYLHGLGICHRDVKPQNLLVDSKSHVLKLCDFGSSKKLNSGEASVPYICSRFYRAPELILGANEYTTAVDTWSIGCVFGELLLGRPLFPGESSIDQLVKVIQILGTPTRQQLNSLSANYIDYEFPSITLKSWKQVLGIHTPSDAVDLINQLLKYEPDKRIKPIEALGHSFFDDLRCFATKLPGGNSLPELFSFTDMELHLMSPDTRHKVIPSWYKNHNSNSKQ